ncbi:hypothetical protein C5613_36120 [Rhodococcus opacus]|uniref:Uncharacterized protein n=1 Tax=Rhodococcus opacus TaxID=37919 RepID=A0A2S8IP09_RHOOP|nr:hypothetical protein C5613_36120 [Rhodococcus opacus]
MRLASLCIDRDVDRLIDVFRNVSLHQPQPVETAMGIQLTALLIQFDAACTASADLADVNIRMRVSFAGAGVWSETTSIERDPPSTAEPHG